MDVERELETAAFRRRRWAWGAVVAAAAVTLVMPLAVGCTSGDDTHASHSDSSATLSTADKRTQTPPSGSSATLTTREGWEGARSIPPQIKPDVTLTDTDGRPFNLKRDTEGFVTLLYIGYLHCPDVCPLHMATLRQAFLDLPPDIASHVKVVFVTADPDRDTPDLIRKWLDLFNRDFIGLWGSQDQINEFVTALPMRAPTKEDLGDGEYSVSHIAYVLAFSTDDLAHLVYGNSVTASDWTHDLRKMVTEGWHE